MRLEALAAACAAGFVCILAVAAYWDPTIRVLHAAEAIPYVLAGVLASGGGRLATRSPS